MKYARSLEDKTDMGGGTFTELEKLGGSGYEEQREMLKRREAKNKSEEQKKKKDKRTNKIGKSDTYDKRRKPNFGNALAKAAIKKFAGLDIEDWGHN